jgi:hypothetical protein
MVADERRHWLYMLTRGIGPQLLPLIVKWGQPYLCSSHVCNPIPEVLGVVRV